MTTRKVSAETDYPFVPELSVADAAVVAGIVDIYFVIQGPPDEESSSSEETDLLQNVYLVDYSLVGDNTLFHFEAVEGIRVWDITFTVPNTDSYTGQVGNDDDSDCRAVLVFNSGKIVQAAGNCRLRVEPGRSQWHTEQVNRLEFYNIGRCDFEETEAEYLVLRLPDGSSSEEMNLAVADGYNCVVDGESGLQFTGGVGLGLGIAPDRGNTAIGCSSNSELDSTEFVSTINGLLPVNGDIPIQTSASIAKRRTIGRLKFYVRQQ